MAIATGEIYQMTLNMSLVGQTVENVFAMRERTGLSTDAQIKTAAQLFWHIYRDVVSVDVTLNGITLQRVTPIALDTIIAPPGAGEGTGSVNNGAIPSVLAVVSTHNTGLAGKSHRGRTYTAGIPNAFTDTVNTVSASALAAFGTMWDAIQTAFGDAAGTNAYLAFGMYSRKIGGTHPETLAGWQAITSSSPHKTLGVQRRRKLGVGI
jgi:hypothetical protein